MKLNFYLTLAACAALATVGGCKGLGGVIAPPATVSAPYGPASAATPAKPPPAPTAAIPAKTVIDEKAMYAAEVVFNVAAQAYFTADENGLITPAVKAKAKPAFVEAYRYLQAARSAYAAGNSPEFLTAVSNLRTMTIQVRELVH